MDKKMHLERDEMDKRMTREREAVDQTTKQERENMYRNLTQLYAEMYKKMQHDRNEMDKKVKEERAATDRTLQQIHDEMVRKLKQEHKAMDQKLQHERTKMESLKMQARADMELKLQQERKAMDYKAKREDIRREGKMMENRAMAEHEQCHMDPDLHLKRAKMDLRNMAPCADMDQNVQRDMDYKAKMEDIRREGRMMEDRAMLGSKADLEECHILSSNQSDVSKSQSPWVIVMEFCVFKDRKLSHVPNGYNNIPGEMTIVEPGKVDWSTMAKHLRPLGYKGDADVYYIKPGCVPPQGMIMISGEDDVHQMLQALQGIKKCDLYIVRNCLYSDSDDSEYGMSEDEECPYDCIDIGEGYQDEDATSPTTMHSSLDNIKKELSFDKGDEQNSV